MTQHGQTANYDPLAKFRDPPGEEGSDIPVPKLMSRAEIEREFNAEESADWGPISDRIDPVLLAEARAEDRLRADAELDKTCYGNQQAQRWERDEQRAAI